MSEPSQQFRALISSPEATEHSETNNDRRGSTFSRYTTLTLEPRACAGGWCATLVFAGQSEKNEEVHTTTASLLNASDASAGGDAKRFESSEVIRITTPDADANRAIQWAQIALEQAWACNARLGCAVVAAMDLRTGRVAPSMHGISLEMVCWQPRRYYMRATTSALLTNSTSSIAIKSRKTA